jgi:DNA-binding winged helix-turn-helix (wHTH) protein
MNVRFGDWEFDTGRRELLKGGRPVPLTPKAFELLELMIENRPRALAKAEIYARLWPSTFVTEVNLSRLVFEVRAALGDDARSPRWVRTARRFGYAFCGAATESDIPVGTSGRGEAACLLVLKDREVALSEGENILGRSRAATVYVESTSVSRQHARIVLRGKEATLEDLGSKNGTRCRDQRVTGPTTLADGDEIRIGFVRMTFRVVTPDVSTSTSD